ncbi:MAG: glutamate--tRNA ligase [Christensenellaceae bacterium]|jgi:glutamyl-tRNA synthetase|nr:glutamate--tRNA ligase [Christensenellaceae bacterium]
MIRTRFAPSPTGFMHIGNLRTALYAYCFARSQNGKFIIRIEDTDRTRYVEGAIDRIYRTLDACGMKEDESDRIEGACGPYVQSKRGKIYAEYAKKLIELGGAYYCFCDKERLESLTDEIGNRKYDKKCASLSKEEIAKLLRLGIPYVIRQKIPTCGTTLYTDLVFGEIQVDCADLEDNILLKSDGMPTYNFANVVDDHLMGITHVIRGTEYLSSTPKYNLIYKSFGWDIPQYMHLTPIMKNERQKLSKRDGDANFEDFTAKGFLPQAIINYIALLGWSPKNNTEKMSLSELISAFSIDGLSKSSSIFDEAKMKWLNSQYIKELPFDEFNKLAIPYYENSLIASKYNYSMFSSLLQQRIDILSEIPEMVAFIEQFENFDTELFVRQKLKTDKVLAKLVLPKLIDLFKNLDSFEHQSINDSIISLCENIGLKKGQVYWILRIALTGKESTPGGGIEIALLLGKNRSLERLSLSYSLLH